MEGLLSIAGCKIVHLMLSCYFLFKCLCVAVNVCGAFLCSFGFVTFDSQDDAEYILKHLVRMILLLNVLSMYFLSICVIVIWMQVCRPFESRNKMFVFAAGAVAPGHLENMP